MNARLESIPAFPPIAAKLLRMTSSQASAAKDVAGLLRTDPALSAEIIHCANSAAFHFKIEIRTIEQAVPLLGVTNTRSIALAAIGRTYLRGTLLIDELRQLWRYNMSCALLAEKIAPSLGMAPDIAYSAALLHDIGRLGLMAAYPAEYSALLQSAIAKFKAGAEFKMTDYERSIFGIDRFAAGTWLARQWNLPKEFCVLAGRYPASSNEKSEVINVVLAGCRLANSIGLGMFPAKYLPSYEQVLDGLPPAVRNGLPAEGTVLRDQVEKEMAVLDAPSRPGVREAEDDIQVLLNNPDAVANVEKRDSIYALRRTRTRTIWVWRWQRLRSSPSLSRF